MTKEFKFSLPNPDQFYSKDVKQFFPQLKTTLKASEKSYQRITEDLTEDEEWDQVFIRYRFPQLTSEYFLDKLIEKAKEGNKEWIKEKLEERGQFIHISVNSL